jgi:hypothetical protein
MKKKIVLVLLIFCLPFLVFANNQKLLGGSYYIKNNQVYFEDKLIKKADFASFEFLGDIYAKDKNRVYVFDLEIFSADLESFEVLKDYYAKDDYQVYIYGTQIKNSDTKSFEVLGKNYAKDKKFVYYEGEKIAKNKNLEYLGGAYLKTNNKLFRYGKQTFSYDIETFKYLGDYYTIDQYYVFYLGGILTGAHKETFEYLGQDYAKDKNFVYLKGKKIIDADSSSFVLLKDNYARDKNFFYLNGLQISSEQFFTRNQVKLLDKDKTTLSGKAAYYLAERGIIKGYDDLNFHGEKKVVRAEIVKFFEEIIGRIKSKEKFTTFTDVKEERWFAPYLVNALKAGYIKGYDDNTFRPLNPIKRGEFLKMLVSAFNLPQNLEHNFEDIKKTWVNPYGGIAQKYNLFPNLTEKLNFGEDLTRDEVAIAFYQYLTFEKKGE